MAAVVLRAALLALLAGQQENPWRLRRQRAASPYPLLRRGWELLLMRLRQLPLPRRLPCGLWPQQQSLPVVVMVTRTRTMTGRVRTILRRLRRRHLG